MLSNDSLIVEEIEELLDQMKLDGTIETITDLQRSLELGVLQPPALIINGVIVATKKLPTIKRIKFFIENIRE